LAASSSIGRPFAWQEMLLTICLLLQNFDFQPDDPSYLGHLKLKQTLTIKPKDWLMKATLRHGMDATDLDEVLQASSDASTPSHKDLVTDKQVNGEETNGSSEPKPLKIYYGSNTGTCEAFAKRLAGDAPRHGFKATVGSLDSAQNKLDDSAPVVIVTSSYEGHPPDNAAHFYEWLESSKEGQFKGVKYAVFGCGHSDWIATFQSIPNNVARLLKENGAEELCTKGEADAKAGDASASFCLTVNISFRTLTYGLDVFNV